MSLPPLKNLIACSKCDTLHKATVLAEGETAMCCRCGTPLMSSTSTAFTIVLTLSLASVVLLISAFSFPFLDLNVQGRKHGTSVLGAIFAFKSTWGIPLAIAIAGFIMVLPLTRLIALIYAISPLVRGSEPLIYARQAFALAEWLRPWSMSEIFIVGVSVALIKVAGLAKVTIGPAFWAFAALVIITVIKDQLICRYSIWEALDKSTA